MVPLSLRADTPKKEAVWLNTEPAGVEYLRPYLKSFEAEDEDMVIKHFIRLQLIGCNYYICLGYPPS